MQKFLILFVHEDDNLIELFVDNLIDFLGTPRDHYVGKHQITFDCPNCSNLKGVDFDGKGNLEINYELGLFNCWACSEEYDTKGFIPKLFKKHSPPSILKKFYSNNFKFSGYNYNTEPVVENKTIVNLPKEYIPLIKCKNKSEFIPAFNYLYNRGVGDDIIEKFNIGFCLSGQYENRIIIPSYNVEGDINYFISRTILKYIKKLKYLNPKIEKKQIIVNELFIDWNKDMFLVEGPFDHLVTPNSIPLLGKDLYTLLFEKIYNNANKKVIIILDDDAIEAAKKIYYKLDCGRLYKNVYICKMIKDTDPAKFVELYGRDNYFNWIKTKCYRLYD